MKSKIIESYSKYKEIEKAEEENTTIKNQIEEEENKKLTLKSQISLYNEKLKLMEISRKSDFSNYNNRGVC